MNLTARRKFLSGLVVAGLLGADYPFDARNPDIAPALSDYHQMQRIMLGRVPPDGPSRPGR